MCALKIIEVRSENVLHLNLEEFKQIIAKDDIAERSLVVISIAGAMRKGKSFLLNFFLTFAYNKYKTTKTFQPKTFKNGSLIDGFSHSGGSERHTTGIQIWPDIFLHDYSDGKKIAIIFMDTQGTFDYETKFCDCVSIFALSTLLSSTQIYNIGYNIQNDHLQYLSLFVEYAKLALNQILPTTEATSPFDTLQILVRDWNFPYQAQYGLAGGKTIIDKIFTASNAEIQKTVSIIKETFKTIECFLMPFPGEAIAVTPRFDGTIENVDKIFLEQVAFLTVHLLSPERLQIKTVNGVEMKVSNFINLIEQGFEVLSKFENIPKPKTIVEATAESQSFKLIADAVEKYKNSMANHLAGKQCLDNPEFVHLHQKYLNESVEFYENSEKWETFDSETNGKWKAHLKESLLRESNYFLILNEKHQPNTSEALQTLISVVTEQKEMIQELNDQHAQDMLDLINTFRGREEEYREQINELTRNFKNSPTSGFNFKNMLMKIIEVVPNAVTTLGLHRTAYGSFAITASIIAGVVLDAAAIDYS